VAATDPEIWGMSVEAPQLRTNHGRARLPQAFAIVLFALLGSLTRLPSAAAGVDELTPTQRAGVARVMKNVMAGHTVGVTVAIERDGKLVFARGYGLADIAAKRATSPTTIYGVGSLTKQIFAAMVLQLVAERRLQLDDRVVTILPKFPHGSEISVRQLLDQTSGLADACATVGVLRYARRRNVPPEDMIALIRGMPLRFTPGSKWEYSNTNYIAAGMVVEALTHRSAAASLRDRITGPLGLSSMGAGAPADAAPPYYFDERGRPRSLPGGDLTWGGGAGMIFADALDLLKWDDGFFTNKVVSADLVREATTPPVLPAGAKTSYAFGWLRTDLASHTMVWHNGQVTVGYADFNAVFPDDRLKIVLQANAAHTVEDPRAAVELAAVFIPAIAKVIHPLPRPLTEDPKVTTRARVWFADLLEGSLPQRDLAAPQPDAEQSGRAIGRFGSPQSIVFGDAVRDGSNTKYVYYGYYPGMAVDLIFTLNPAGKVMMMTIAPAP
jgi:D-alanyl-D-alanine carboxypeptidase